MRSRLLRFATAGLLAIHCGHTSQAVTLDDLSYTVAYLHEGNRIGTGFFVKSAHPYLVTADHVAQILTRLSTATCRAPGDVPVTLVLGDLVQAGPSLAWYHHPEADVAVLPLVVNEKTLPALQNRFLTLEAIPADESAPSRERSVTVMGFPLALGTTGRFSPITSEAKPASGLVRIARADTKHEATFFVLDKPSIGGFSGAPVFLTPGPFDSGGNLVLQPSLRTVVGLVHGTISDNTGGKLAAVVPSKFIRDALLAADRVTAPNVP
jgi:Trypsin-like peptidase domain